MRKGATMSNYNGQFQDSSANILLATPHSYANIEGTTASQAYVKGQMLVYNNRLCEVTSAISAGNTLTIGTNIAYKNVGDIGKQLVASDGKGFYFDVKDGSYGFYPSASKVASEFVPFGGSAAENHAITYGASSASSPISCGKCSVFAYAIACSSVGIPSDAKNIHRETYVPNGFYNQACVYYELDSLSSGTVVASGGSLCTVALIMYNN